MTGELGDGVKDGASCAALEKIMEGLGKKKKNRYKKRPKGVARVTVASRAVMSNSLFSSVTSCNVEKLS